MAKSKYEKYVIPAPIRIGEIKQMPHPMVFQMGRECWDGANFSMDMSYIIQPVTIVDFAHTHKYDTYFTFIGGDPRNIRDFQAEIWMYLGEEQEKIVITSPTSIWVPAGMPHCPFIVKKVTKPVIYMGFTMSAFDDTMPIPKSSQWDKKPEL